MLIKDFYKVLSIEQSENKYDAFVFIYREHDIFKGHFPDSPVMPGVCTMQIIKELTEQIVGKKLMMVQSNNIKFRAIINPRTHPKLLIQLTIKEDGEAIKVKNVTKFEDTIALQLSAVYKEV